MYSVRVDVCSRVWYLVRFHHVVYSVLNQDIVLPIRAMLHNVCHYIYSYSHNSVIAISCET